MRIDDPRQIADWDSRRTAPAGASDRQRAALSTTGDRPDHRSLPPNARTHIGVHVELFAANRVMIVPAGVGTRPPRTLSAARISRARCDGDLVTLEPTGIVLIRAGQHLTLLRPLPLIGTAPCRPVASGHSRRPHHTRVTVYVGGQHGNRPPGDVPLFGRPAFRTPGASTARDLASKPALDPGTPLSGPGSRFHAERADAPGRAVASCRLR
jgi:hypothetical protein